jgi:hypothetical protein
MGDSVRKNGAVTGRLRSHNKDVSLLYYIFGYFLTMAANPHNAKTLAYSLRYGSRFLQKRLDFHGTARANAFFRIDLF